MARATPRQNGVLYAGPWRLVNDNIDSSVATTDTVATTLSAATNMYPDPQFGAWVGRPGWRYAGAGSSGQILNGRIQGGIAWTKRETSGAITRFNVIMSGGNLWTYDDGTGTFQQVASTATFTAATITVSATARVSMNIISNQVFVSDGINTPFLWDGTTGGGLTKATASPVLYGNQSNYYVKNFGIKATNRARLVWSEEDDPNVGYENAPYNNFWDSPGSQDGSPMTGLIGTNDALFIYRERSIVSITGRVDTQFVTTGVRADVSTDVGLISPWTLIFTDEFIFFQDADGRPRIQQGGTVDDSLWRECRNTINGLNLGALGVSQAALFPNAEIIVLGVPEVAQSEMTAIMAFSTLGGSMHFCGMWRGIPPFTALWVGQDAFGGPMLMRGDSAAIVYKMGNPETGPFRDVASNAAISAIQHSLKTFYLGADTDTEKNFSRTDIVLRAQTGVTVGVGYQTPRTTSVPLTLTASGGGTVYDAAVYDAAIYAGDAVEVHKAIGHGQNANGRWMQLTLNHQAVDQQLAVQRLSTTYLPASRQPRTP